MTDEPAGPYLRVYVPTGRVRPAHGQAAVLYYQAGRTAVLWPDGSRDEPSPWRRPRAVVDVLLGRHQSSFAVELPFAIGTTHVTTATISANIVVLWETVDPVRVAETQLRDVSAALQPDLTRRLIRSPIELNTTSWQAMVDLVEDWGRWFGKWYGLDVQIQIEPELPEPPELSALSALSAHMDSAHAADLLDPHLLARSLRSSNIAAYRAGQLGNLHQDLVEELAQARFGANMPAEVEVGRLATVQVTISREAIGLLAGISELADAEMSSKRPIVVEVLPVANCEVVGRSSIETQPPDPGRPVSLLFTMRMTDAGTGHVEVMARQGPIPLVTLMLRPAVVPAAGVAVATMAAQPAITSNVSAPLVEVSARSYVTTPTTCVRQWLRVTERTLGDRTVFDFTFEAEDLRIFSPTYTSPPIAGSRADYVRALYERIEDQWLTSHQDRVEFAEKMRDLGGQLFDELLPVELRALLWDRRDQLQNILLLTDDPYLPWELLHLKPPGGPLPSDRSWFLAELGLARWLPGTWPVDRLRCRPGRARSIIPNYPREHRLPDALAEEGFLQETLHAQPVTATASAVRRLLAEPGSFDVLHFAGHGVADSDDITKSKVLLDGRTENGTYIPEYLEAVTVAQRSRLGDPAVDIAPLIVLNACQAGRLGTQLTSLGGFARAFLDQGAGAFIGSLWSIGDAPALSFTEAFYRSLLAGNLLSQAAVAGRNAARAAGEASWLAFVVYGNPCATFTLE